jgi:hypothetical protein
VGFCSRSVLRRRSSVAALRGGIAPAFLLGRE